MIATLTFASLCSRAVFRDGLLSVLEAGLEQFEPDSYPATIAPTLVVRLDFGGDDFGQPTKLRVEVEHEDGERFSEIGFAVTYEPPTGADPRLAHFWVLIHELPLQLRRDGLHRVNVLLNGDHVRQLPFVAASRQPPV